MSQREEEREQLWEGCVAVSAWGSAQSQGRAAHRCVFLSFSPRISVFPFQLLLPLLAPTAPPHAARAWAGGSLPEAVSLLPPQ